MTTVQNTRWPEIRVPNQTIIRLAKSYLAFANENQNHQNGFCSWSKKVNGFKLLVQGEYYFDGYALFDALTAYDQRLRNGYFNKEDGVSLERIEYAKRLIQTFENEGVKIVYDETFCRWQIKAVTNHPDAKNRRDRLVRWVKATVNKNLQSA